MRGTHPTDTETAQEVYNAKAEGSNQGVRNIVEPVVESGKNFVKGASNAIANPSQTIERVSDAVVTTAKGIPDIPRKMVDATKDIVNTIKETPERISGAYEDFTYKRYEENLAIMQGRGLEAKHEFAASTTANGITIGIGAAGVVKAGTSAVKVLTPDVPDVKNLPDVKADVPNQTNRTPEGYEPDNDLLSNKPSGRQEYYNFNQMSAEQIAKLEKEVRSRSPIDIPDSVEPKINHKPSKEGSGGFEQIEYIWVENGIKYQSRWHTRTPGAPPAQGNSWVVTRKVQGTKTTSSGPLEYKLSDGTWVNETDWRNAIRARARGNETVRQREILDKGVVA